jgi:hypothetical protein
MRQRRSRDRVEAQLVGLAGSAFHESHEATLSAAVADIRHERSLPGMSREEDTWNAHQSEIIGMETFGLSGSRKSRVELSLQGAHSVPNGKGEGQWLDVAQWGHDLGRCRASGKAPIDPCRAL